MSDRAGVDAQIEGFSLTLADLVRMDEPPRIPVNLDEVDWANYEQVQALIGDFDWILCGELIRAAEENGVLPAAVGSFMSQLGPALFESIHAFLELPPSSRPDATLLYPEGSVYRIGVVPEGTMGAEPLRRAVFLKIVRLFARGGNPSLGIGYNIQVELFGEHGQRIPPRNARGHFVRPSLLPEELLVQLQLTRISLPVLEQPLKGSSF